MELIRSLHNLREHHRKCVATIGNFDGLHLGHQAIISQLKEIANKYNLPAIFLTSQARDLPDFRAWENLFSVDLVYPCIQTSIF